MDQYEYGYLYEVDGHLDGKTFTVRLLALQGTRLRLDAKARLEALNSLGMDGWVIDNGQWFKIENRGWLADMANEAYPDEMHRLPNGMEMHIMWTSGTEFFMRRIKRDADPGQ